MEPMTLGSPSGSPAANPSPYLPSFLMGEAQAPTTPRNNTLSPNKSGRNISFVTSPGLHTSQDYNRSNLLTQKTLFGGYQTPNAGNNISSYAGTPGQSHNASVTGPPTQGLFDSLRSEGSIPQAPIRTGLQPQGHFDTPVQAQHVNAYSLNQTCQSPLQQMPPINNSYLSNGNASFNVTNTMLSPLGPSSPNTTSGLGTSHMLQCPPTPRYTEFWVTVFGFPPSATSMVMDHFAQCGTIVDKVFPPQNGNWVHIKYSSRLECDKAINYNEKILANNIMIGVTQCKDRNIIDKENTCGNMSQLPRVRPLAQMAYKGVHSESSVMSSPNAPQKSSGLMNKAIDLFFGW